MNQTIRLAPGASDRIIHGLHAREGLPALRIAHAWAAIGPGSNPPVVIYLDPGDQLSVRAKSGHGPSARLFVAVSALVDPDSAPPSARVVFEAPAGQIEVRFLPGGRPW